MKVILSMNESLFLEKFKQFLRSFTIYSVSQENPDTPKNMFLLKNPQFLPNFYETLSKWSTHEDLLLTKSYLILDAIAYVKSASDWYFAALDAAHCTYKQGT